MGSSAERMNVLHMQDGCRGMVHCQDCVYICVARRCVVLTPPSRWCLNRCTCLVWNGWWTPSRAQ